MCPAVAAARDEVGRAGCQRRKGHGRMIGGIIMLRQVMRGSAVVRWWTSPLSCAACARSMSGGHLADTAGLPEPVRVGDTKAMERTFEAEDVATFAKLSGDTNPLHASVAEAAREGGRAGRFGFPVVHGALINSVVSAVIGTQLPGPGSVYLSQELHFPAPLRVGVPFTTRVTVASIEKRRPVMRCDTLCTDVDGAVVLSGHVDVVVPLSVIRAARRAASDTAARE